MFVNMLLSMLVNIQVHIAVNMHENILGQIHVTCLGSYVSLDSFIMLQRFFVIKRRRTDIHTELLIAHLSIEAKINSKQHSHVVSFFHI